jgi:hypothetical protein
MAPKHWPTNSLMRMSTNYCVHIDQAFFSSYGKVLVNAVTGHRPKIHLYDYATSQHLKALMPQRVLLHSAALRMSCLGSETSAWGIPFEVKEPARISL